MSGPTCAKCAGRRHVQTTEGTFVRCPECYAHSHVLRELHTRKMPSAWGNLEPLKVVDMFGQSTPVGAAITHVLSGKYRLVHAHGFPSHRRTAFVGSIAYGTLAAEKDLQVLDTADLSMRHFSKDEKDWPVLKQAKCSTLLTFGREVEARLGMFYFREILDRAVDHSLPLVVITDHTLDMHAPRYSDLMEIIQAAQFDVTNLRLD